jgi:hypothetical protein
MVNTRPHVCITRERRVGGYYDPSTDQFLSVDPEVASTGQPYAFTRDDPLNQTDPLGLSGSAGIAAEVQYDKETAEFAACCARTLIKLREVHSATHPAENPIQANGT